VFGDGRPAWVAELPIGYPRAEVARRVGLRAGFCIPLVASRGPLGALEFFSTESQEADAELLATMASLGGQIGQHLERRRAEEELRASEARMRSTLEAAFDAIVTMDADGAIVNVNRAAEDMFGLPAEDMVGHELADTIIPLDLREPHRRGLARYLATGAGPVLDHPLELRAQRVDGSEFPVEVAIRRLDVPGPPVFTGFIRELTERKHAEAEIRALAAEQAALRRVATLVAQGADHDTVVGAVTREVAGILGADTANLVRFNPDHDSGQVVGAWSAEDVANVELGTTVVLEGGTVSDQVRRTGAPARVDSYDGLPGALAERLRGLGFRAAVGAPVIVDGHLWGAIMVSTVKDEPFPPGAEERMAAFTELVGQAVSNADTRAQLAASRARLVAAGDAERRRLERNLHDGAQQRLVSTAVLLRVACAQVERDPTAAAEQLSRATDELEQALRELRELARGLHPAILSQHGLAAGIESLATRAPVPVNVTSDVPVRLPEPIEAAAYYVVAEALTNVARYAHASLAAVDVRAANGRLAVEVIDDGVGGAVARPGSGLSGLVDRVEALGGTLTVTSDGGGTRLSARLPVAGPDV